MVKGEDWTWRNDSNSISFIHGFSGKVQARNNEDASNHFMLALIYLQQKSRKYVYNS
jgi:hypothetical protein